MTRTIFAVTCRMAMAILAVGMSFISGAHAASSRKSAVRIQRRQRRSEPHGQPRL